MKCPSCKYENRYCSKTVDEVIYYKSGKRKGEIKEVTTKTVEFYSEDPEFIEITTKQGDEFQANLGGYWCLENISLYACPKCGTVIIKELLEE